MEKEKININLSIEIENEVKDVQIEMVEFWSNKKIVPYTKLIGRVVGDKDKIVFGTRRNHRMVIFQIYDFKNLCTLDFSLIDKYLYFVYEQVMVEPSVDSDIEYIDYGFSYPVEAKFSYTKISDKETAVISEEIMDNFNEQTNVMRELIDDEVFACEHEYYQNSAEVMDINYKKFCTLILFQIINDAGVVVKTKNGKLNKLIKLIASQQQMERDGNKFVEIMNEFPVDDIDDMYDQVLTEFRKHHQIFEEYDEVLKYIERASKF